MPATPVLKMRLTSVFATVLQVNAHQPKLGKRNNAKIRVEGDVITLDEFLDVLQKQHEENGKKGKSKKKQNEEGIDKTFSHTHYSLCSSLVEKDICQVCKVKYDEDDDDKDGWIGCDGDCNRWYHYWCAGFKRMSTSRQQFLCQYCKKGATSNK